MNKIIINNEIANEFYQALKKAKEKKLSSDTCETCGSQTEIVIEQRDNNYSEIISYCPTCGSIYKG